MTVTVQVEKEKLVPFFPSEQEANSEKGVLARGHYINDR